MKTRRLAAGVLLAVIASCGGGGDDGTGPPTQDRTLASIRLANGTLALTAGQTATLSAEALDASGAAIANVSGYTYTSSAPAFAEVRGDGTVLAVSAGSATITVTLTRDGVTANATATVTVTGTLPSSVTVTAGTDNAFNPQTVVVARNAVVTYAFAATVHNVTYSASSGAPTDIGNTSTASVARTFATAGDYGYQCTIHSGMTGTVIVR
jgi:plastocyanin